MGGNGTWESGKIVAEARKKMTRAEREAKRKKWWIEILEEVRAKNPDEKIGPTMSAAIWYRVSDRQLKESLRRFKNQ